MQGIQLNAILGRVSTKSDGSLSLNFSTSEMDAAETTVLIKLTRINLQMLLTPKGEALEPPVEVKSELSQKTPCSRLRAVMFVAYKQNVEVRQGEDFDTFYKRHMETIIENWKGSLNDL